MNTFTVKSHKVIALKIASVQPLVRSGAGPMSPDAGLTLVLENDSKHDWVTHKNESVPQVGDFLVHDELMNVTYVVPVAKFTALFRGA